MVKRMKILSLGLIIVGSLVLASCGGANQEPTPDVASIQTQAVMQAMAQLTVDAAMNPSATPVPRR
jgi:outer membrane murein-binding lipoprotein Lpp